MATIEINDADRAVDNRHIGGLHDLYTELALRKGTCDISICSLPFVVAQARSRLQSGVCEFKQT